MRVILPIIFDGRSSIQARSTGRPPIPASISRCCSADRSTCSRRRSDGDVPALIKVAAQQGKTVQFSSFAGLGLRRLRLRPRSACQPRLSRTIPKRPSASPTPPPRPSTTRSTTPDETAQIMVKHNPLMNLDTVKTQWAGTIKSIQTPLCRQDTATASRRTIASAALDRSRQAGAQARCRAQAGGYLRQARQVTARSRAASRLMTLAALPSNDTASMSIAIQNVSKSFGTTLAVEDVSFSLAENSFVSIVGPSGCGKSTLLRMIAGLDRADAGDSPRPRQTGASPRSHDVGMVFQCAGAAALAHHARATSCSSPKCAADCEHRKHRDRALELIELAGLVGLREAAIRTSCRAACSSASRSAAPCCSSRRSS